MTIIADGKRKGDVEPPAYEDHASSRGTSSPQQQQQQQQQQQPGASGPATRATAAPSGLSGTTNRNVSVQSNGDVLCTDDMVNRDANAMYNFLLSQTSIPPRIVCRIVGKHEETRVEEQLVEETTYKNGPGPYRRVNRGGRRQSTEDIPPSSPVNDVGGNPTSGRPTVSFQPGSDLTPHPVSSGDGETRVRRTQTKQQISKTVQVTAFDFSIDLAQYLLPKPVLWTVADEELAHRGGLLKERWIGHQNANREREDIDADQSLLRSSKSLKTWVKDFIDRPGPLKQFEWTKGVDGWDWESLREAIKGTILRSGYAGDVTVTFNVTGRQLVIRPPGLWASMSSNTFGNTLLWFSLVKPYLLYYYKQGRWTIGGEVWNFRRGDAGMKEGEWFRTWESTIEKAVEKRMTIKDVLKKPWSESPGAALEGYRGA